MLHELFYGVSEQAKASRHRLDDAHALLDAKRWRGAMYMAGYCIECLLKMKLMRIHGCRHLGELEEELERRGQISSQITVFTHQLDLLLLLANGLDRLRGNKQQWKLFNKVNRWVPAWRYSPDLSNREDAEEFVSAVDQIAQWIENNT